MLCPACEGKYENEDKSWKCPECKEGQIDVTECPLDLITEDVWQAMQLAELYEKGLPPIAGGAIDQAKIFIDAAQFIMNEKAHWKSKLGILD
ncbi:MAG: hypothetical protein ABSG99_02675 [Sedimentisphaerales bacterium]